jgi:hypothetical protein
MLISMAPRRYDNRELPWRAFQMQGGMWDASKKQRSAKIVFSPSYADIRSRANTTMRLDFEHMIKARAHKEGVRIGKTPKKLASICCL